MKKKRSASFHDPIFRYDILVRRGGTLKEFYKSFGRWCHREIEEPIREGYAHFVTIQGVKALGLWFSSSAGTGAIVHECTHAAMHVSREILGSNPTFKNEEFLCYYSDWLARQTVGKLWD